MSARYQVEPTWSKVAIGLLYGRTRELIAPRSWIRLAILAAAVAGVLSLAAWPGGDEGFWDAAVRLFLMNFAPLYCLVKAGDALRGELKDGGIEYLWTRPVGRIPLYLGFYLSALLSVAWALGVCVLSILAASAAVGAWPGWEGAFALALATGLAGLAFAAISLALAAFSSKYAVLGFLYFSLVEQGLSRIPTSVREIAVSRHVREISASLLDLGQGDLGRAAVGAIAIAVAAFVVGAAVFATSAYQVGGSKDA